MGTSWRAQLPVDPTPWLLEPESPAAAVCGLLMQGGVHRYHVGIPWTALQSPPLGRQARSGHILADPRISEAAEYLLSRQLDTLERLLDTGSGADGTGAV